ncbi:MAG TPA: flagellar basal body rod protein FlgC [Phycisphaerales bacterium]|nr:flagellar basal body rod protein FlgC [Phycisphaerales bacterium]
MFGSLDISTSGLAAQRARLDVISGNIANASTLTNAKGEYEPYRKRSTIFSTGDPAHGSELGVHVDRIDKDTGPLNLRYEPDSPFADSQGMVGYPNVNLVLEQMEAMEAARGYEANIAAIEASKSMTTVALEVLA